MKYSLPKVLIVGYGSIGAKHAKILKNFKCKVVVMTQQKNIPFDVIRKKKEILKYNPDYIVISNRTSEHLKILNFLEKNFSKKKVLIEKPILNKFRKINLKKNKYIVGYNMRFHPVIQYLKKEIGKRKINFISINLSSYLPNWRKNIDYKKSNSAKKIFGGGLLLELSHELDYIRWIFGNIKLIFSFNKHISNLKINTDDILILFGNIRKKTKVIFNMNFFSRINRRNIIIEGDGFSLNADLIKGKIEIFSNKKTKRLSWKNFNILKTYYLEHKKIFNNDLRDFCTFKEAMDTLKLIKRIKR